MKHDPKNEAEVEALIRIEGPRYGCILMRNNSGAMKDVTGRVVRFGLGNESKNRSEVIKSSDEIGITTIVITQEMVGQKIGVFTAVEVKEPGWNPNKKLDRREQAQKNFIDFVRLKGGFAGFAWDLDSFKKVLGK